MSTIPNLLESLRAEISRATAGSTDGQFPILDLLGNLRDAAQSSPAHQELAASAARAWERLVAIVEAAQPFSSEHIQWLNELAAALAGPPNAGEPSIVPPENPVGPKPLEVPQPGPAPEDQPMLLNVPEDLEVLREFLNESREHLDNIEQGVLVLEGRPSDVETLSTIFRAFHTFKGSAGFLNLVPINRLAHRLETLLDLVRQNKLAVDRPIIELMLRGRDCLKQFLDAIQAQVAGSRPLEPIAVETASLKAALQTVIERAADAVVPQAEPPSVESFPAEPITTIPTAPPPVPLPAAPAPVAENQPAARSSDHSSVVRVDTTKLDALLDLIGEMVISQSLVSAGLTRLAETDPQFAHNIAQMSRTTKELQRVGMSMRMVPIRGVFQKMARVVRDIGAKQGKQVQLLTSGEDTELDRGVVEELNDPLLHMIRNSVDHGIESQEARARSGKKGCGTVHLRAFHQGGSIVIEIEDDGGGLSRDKILAKAIQRGLISPDAKPADQEVLAFIFAAGFSTADKVTDISGRGVGLDVARKNIERLRGCIDVSSRPGSGSKFTITLPLTLAIIDGLVVKVGNERYIIPTLSVRESFRPRPEMITRIQGKAEVVDVRGRLLPLLRLYEHFGLQPKSTDPTQSIIIVAQSGTNFRCLLVDSLESKQEVVIKSLNDLMVHKNQSLAGAAILGDGRVGLILDVNALVQPEKQTFAAAA